MCPVCNQQWDINPISDEETCFVHGREDGSEFEKMIWEQNKS